MKRNDNRTYYDRGYSDAVQERRKDAAVPKVLGVGMLTAFLLADQYWFLGFVVIWAAFELVEKWDLEKYHESDPPPQWFDE